MTTNTCSAAEIGCPEITPAAETPIDALWRRREAISPEYDRLERAHEEAQVAFERLRPTYADEAALTVQEARWIADGEIQHPYDDERKRTFAAASGIREALATLNAGPPAPKWLVDGLAARLAATEAYETAEAAARVAAGVDEADAAFDVVFAARRDLDAAILAAPIDTLSDLRRKAAIVRLEWEGFGVECEDGIRSVLAALVDPPPVSPIGERWPWRQDLAAEVARLEGVACRQEVWDVAFYALERADDEILALPVRSFADLEAKAMIARYRAQGCCSPPELVLALVDGIAAVGGSPIR